MSPSNNSPVLSFQAVKSKRYERKRTRTSRRRCAGRNQFSSSPAARRTSRPRNAKSCPPRNTSVRSGAFHSTICRLGPRGKSAREKRGIISAHHSSFSTRIQCDQRSMSGNDRKCRTASVARFCSENARDICDAVFYTKLTVHAI